MTLRRAPCRQAGFTLVELLVVLTVSALVIGLASVSLSLAHASWIRMHAQTESVLRLQPVRNLVRDLLSHAVPETAMDEKRRRLVRFYGSATEITFLSPLLDCFGASDIAIFTLRFSRSSLWIGWRLDRPANIGEAPYRRPEVQILAGLWQPEVQYYGVQRPGQTATWTSVWMGQAALPELIRIHLSSGPEDPIPFGRDLLVAPIITGDPCGTLRRNEC